MTAEPKKLPNLIVCTATPGWQVFVGEKTCEDCHEYVSAARIRELIEEWRKREARSYARYDMEAAAVYSACAEDLEELIEDGEGQKY